MKRWLILVLQIGLLVLVGGAGYLGYTTAKPPKPSTVETPTTITVARGDVEQTVTAPGVLVSAREIILSASIGGRLAKINVRAGERVKVNDVLAELDDTELKFALQTAQANLASAQATYDALANKYAHRDDQIIVAKSALDKAQVALQQAQSVYDQVAWRSDIGMLPQSRSLQLATIDYQSALASYRLATLAIPSSQDLALAQANVVAAQVVVAQAKERLSRTKISAPFDGVAQEVKAHAGDTVNSGSPLIQLMDLRLEARATITEEDYRLIHIGQSVQIYLDAQPELIITGKVARIVPLRENTSPSPLYPIYIQLDQTPAGLAPGMTADASIQIAKRANVLRLPRALVRANADGVARINLWNNTRKQSEERRVQTGLRGNQYIEIIDGLSEGDQVVSRKE